MYEIFYIEEILLRIFSHFRYESKKSLAICARVCQLWFDPAIEVLMEDTEFMAFFYGVFGARGVLGIQYIGSGEYIYKDPVQSDWDRFYRYSKKIRGLWMTGVGTWPPKYMKWLSKPQHSAGGPLFPCVRGFHPRPRDKDRLRLSLLLLNHTPYLTDYTITLVSMSPLLELNDFWIEFRSILERCTDLEGFLIRPPDDRPAPIIILKVLASLPGVKRILGTFGNQGPGVRVCWQGARPLRSCLLMGDSVPEHITNLVNRRL